MTQLLTDHEKWRAVLRRQSISNAQRWVTLIHESEDPALFISGNYENLLRALESALRAATTHSLAYQLIQSMHVTVVDYADWDRWLVYLQQAFTYSREQELQAEMADLSVKIGEIQYNMGRLNEAEKSYQDGAERYHAQHDHADYARTLARIAVLRDLQGNPQEGITLCEQALQIARDVHDNWGMAQINLNMSHIYRRMRDWEMSLKAASTAYDLFQQLRKHREASKALVNIVATLAELGEWEVVDLISKSLMDRLKAASDIYTLSRLKNNLGVVAFTQANYPLAEASWQEALVLHSQIQEPKEVATLYNNLGMVYTQMAEWETAEEMLHKAIQAYTMLGDVFNCANAMDNLADLYEMQEKTAASQEILQSAEAKLQEIEEMPHAQDLLIYIRSRLDQYAQ